MKNTIKLSLVAAVAVAGLTTNAAAGSLEDAIKDTTISGKAMVGYNYVQDKSGATDDSSNQTEYDLDLTLTTKVNDTVSATIGFQADHTVDVRNETTNTNGSDSITLTKLYFTAKTDVATIMVGKQKQPTPFLDDERGDGVVALIPAGPVTIAAGHISGLLAEQDITTAAVIGTFGPVNASVWVLDVSNGSTDAVDATYLSNGVTELTAAVAAGKVAGYDGYSVNLSSKVGPVNLDFTHTDIDYAEKEDASLTKLIASAKVADVNLVLGYGVTNDNDNGRGDGVDLTGDHDAKSNFRLDQIQLDAFNDADALLLGASMTFGKTTVGASYLMATANDYNAGKDLDATELDLTVSYAMSKNFSITGLYADTKADQGSTNIIDTKNMELSLNYKF